MRIEKLKLNKDFRRIYGRGRSCVSPYIVTYCMRGRTKNIRIGITVGKKIGNAVKRNRARRVITAAFCEVFNDIAPSTDIVFVARTRILGVKSTVIANVIKEHLSELGVLKNEQ